jgi:TPR repeat protein
MDQQLRRGDRVVLTGLKGRAELNGRGGTVFGSKNDRLVVVLSSSSSSSSSPQGGKEQFTGEYDANAEKLSLAPRNLLLKEWAVRPGPGMGAREEGEGAEDDMEEAQEDLLQTTLRANWPQKGFDDLEGSQKQTFVAMGRTVSREYFSLASTPSEVLVAKLERNEQIVSEFARSLEHATFAAISKENNRFLSGGTRNGVPAKSAKAFLGQVLAPVVRSMCAFSEAHAAILTPLDIRMCAPAFLEGGHSIYKNTGRPLFQVACSVVYFANSMLSSFIGAPDADDIIEEYAEIAAMAMRFFAASPVNISAITGSVKELHGAIQQNPPLPALCSVLTNRSPRFAAELEKHVSGASVRAFFGTAFIHDYTRNASGTDEVSLANHQNRRSDVWRSTALLGLEIGQRFHEYAARDSPWDYRAVDMLYGVGYTGDCLRQEVPGFCEGLVQCLEAPAFVRFVSKLIHRLAFAVTILDGITYNNPTHHVCELSLPDVVAAAAFFGDLLSKTSLLTDCIRSVATGSGIEKDIALQILHNLCTVAISFDAQRVDILPTVVKMCQTGAPGIKWDDNAPIFGACDAAVAAGAVPALLKDLAGFLRLKQASPIDPSSILKLSVGLIGTRDGKTAVAETHGIDIESIVAEIDSENLFFDASRPEMDLEGWAVLCKSMGSTLTKRSAKDLTRSYAQSLAERRPGVPEKDEIQSRVMVDVPEAWRDNRDAMRDAAERGDSHAEVLMAIDLQESDPAAAKQWATKAIEHGSDIGLTVMASLMERAGNFEEVLKYSRRAFKSINRDVRLTAHMQAGAMLCGYRGYPATRKTVAEGLPLLETAAKAGFADAQLKLGKMYRDGVREGGQVLVRQSPSKAINWFEKAVSLDRELPHVEAIYEYAMMHRDAECVKQDIPLCVKLLTSAASMDYHPACKSLGAIFGKGGPGLAPDQAKAMYWTEKAATLGNIEASYNLGMGLYYGMGSAPDIPRAMKWLQAAADQDFVPAMEAVCGVGRDHLPHDVLLKYAQRLASQGRPDMLHVVTTGQKIKVQSSFSPLSRTLETESVRKDGVCGSCGAKARQGAPHKPLLSCSGCRAAHYCSATCQKLAWPSHKGNCKQLQAFVGATKR